MTISNFCEKQFVLNDTTLIVQKPLFDPKIQNFINFMFNQNLYYYCVKFYQNGYNASCFIMFYTAIPTSKNRQICESCDFRKIDALPPCT